MSKWRTWDNESLVRAASHESPGHRLLRFSPNLSEPKLSKLLENRRSLHFTFFTLGLASLLKERSTTSVLTTLTTLTTMTTVSRVDSSSLRTSTELWWATWTSTTTAGLSTTNYCWLHFQLFRPLVVVGCGHLPFNGLPLRGDVSIEIGFFFFFLGLKFFTNPLFIWQKGAFAATAAVFFFFSHFPPYDEELSNSELRTLLRRINSWSLSLSLKHFLPLSLSISLRISIAIYPQSPHLVDSATTFHQWVCAWVKDGRERERAVAALGRGKRYEEIKSLLAFSSFSPPKFSSTFRALLSLRRRRCRRRRSSFVGFL